MKVIQDVLAIPSVVTSVSAGKGAATDLPAESRSPWMDARPAPGFAPLDGEITVDVAIVGGGITGLTAAILLSEAGKTVALVEARRIAQGESGLTTAHLTAYPDAGMRALVDHFGKDKARTAWEAGASAIDRIEQLIVKRGILCDFQRLPAFLYTESATGAAALEDELAACKEAGVPASLAREGLPGPQPMMAALRFDGQAQMHPREYLVPLARALVRNGGHVFEETRALQVVEDPSPRVITEHGVIHARDVIVATNAPMNNVVALQTKIAHYRTYAIGARITGPAPKGLFWDDLDPYHYVRTHRIGGADLLIVGGEDHRTGQEHDTNERYRALMAWASERFPIGEVEYRWSGQIVEPVDGLPYIGHNSFSEHVWEATGYSGNGMTFGTVAGHVLSELVQGRPNPWGDLFEATRITPVASAVEYIKENASTFYHLVKDRLAIDPTGIHKLPRGEGGIFNVRMRRIAAYRDHKGELHTLSPVCSHLKCIVDFNKAEKTWDCPCHGSRYDIDGQVLNGPATHALEKIEMPVTPEVPPTL